ncbi:NB-ARC domain-containing protein [Streptomyces sp. NPDC050844]|uniref:NB-ARC domain-containing protein n=1 Tax=Streptomyces sp. NPDC050844 TaxID=3155790 RepID=UPI0033FE4CDE
MRGFLYALGVDHDRIPPDLDSQVGLYRSLVDGRRMLIVLDNARDTEQVAPLLPAGSSCSVLITSRKRLAGLVTAHHAQPMPLGALSAAEARDLLTNRLAAAQDAAEPATIEELLEYCTGFPLALGIVAGHAVAHPHLPLETWTVHLRDEAKRLASLDGGEAAASMSAVLSWSYGALEPPQAEAFRLLGLAPSPDIGLPAAAALIGVREDRAARVLAELELASLIEQYVPGRYRMHDLIRLYAVEQAERDHNRIRREAALRRVLDFYDRTATRVLGATSEDDRAWPWLAA